MTTTPPGWYDDGNGSTRWWDGSQWTEHVHVADAAAPVAAEATAAEAPVAAGAPVAAEVPASAAAPVAASPAAAPYPGAAYPGAPGAYPGAPGGVFADATEPKKSKLWILWVVLGVVAVGLVVLAFILVPLVIGLVTGATRGESGGTPDETAAVTAVKLYDQAWDTADCDKFLTATTEAFRTLIQIEDCATFESASADFTDSTDNYVLVVDDVSTTDSTVTVSTTETYDSLYDASGELLDQPESTEERYDYTVIRDGDVWAIDGADTVTD